MAGKRVGLVVSRVYEASSIMILYVNVSHIHWAIYVYHWGSRLAALIRHCSPPVIHCSTGLVCLRWWMTLSDCSMWYGTPPVWPNLSAAKSSYWIWQKYVNMYHIIVNNTELLITTVSEVGQPLLEIVTSYSRLKMYGKLAYQIGHMLVFSWNGLIKKWPVHDRTLFRALCVPWHYAIDFHDRFHGRFHGRFHSRFHGWFHFKFCFHQGTTCSM